MQTTVEFAEQHFAELLQLVSAGEEVVVHSGSSPVARIVPFGSCHPSLRPQVGEVTSGPVRWSDASFEPLNDAGLRELGLL